MTSAAKHELKGHSDQVLALAFALNGAVFQTAAQTLPAHYRVTNNMPYVTGGLSRQWMDLYYVPSNATPTPAVV